MTDAPELAALVERSNRLGADRRITNFGGGNTSAKLTLPDPVTGEPTRVLAVKGSGGDLGTLTVGGLALLRLEHLLALEAMRSSGVGEDDLVARYADCAFGAGGATPSIDTPLHALIDVAHVDHLHPDAMIALATAVDGAELVRRCYGDEVGWLDWQRPGFDLGLALRDLRLAQPQLVGAVLGGHGAICWADTSKACEALSLELVAKAEAFLAEHGHPDPLGPVVAGFEALEETARRVEAAALAPIVRGLAASERPMVGHFTDAPVVLDFLSRARAGEIAALGTSCPDHFLRTKVRPLLLDLPASAPRIERVERLRELHAAYRADYAAYYDDAHAEAASPAMRGADPVIVLLPGVGMFSFGVDAATARVAGEFYVNAINVARGACSVSTYAPISDREKFRVEYWELEERKLRMRPPAPPLQGRVALVTGGASGIGLAIGRRLSAEGACVAVVDLDHEAAEKAAVELPGPAVGVAGDVTDEGAVADAFAAIALAFGGVDIVVNNAGFAAAAPLLDTTVEVWDALHAVLARGSFLVARARAAAMLAQGRGGDIVYIVSKNALVAGPENIAYSSAKADQAHQVRLLAAELGPAGIRVNGVNPDGVVKGSGIFSGEWLEQRAAAYGVAPEDLGRHYASRTLLGEEVLPSHVADAVFTLVGGELSRTTGLLVPVDGGLPAAFVR